jgi:hypothetical protein
LQSVLTEVMWTPPNPQSHPRGEDPDLYLPLKTKGPRTAE